MRTYNTWSRPRYFTPLERARFDQQGRELNARLFAGTLPALAYNEADAYARWLLDRATPGAFAKAKTANRLAQLNKHRTCYGCGGRGFCHCETLTAADLANAFDARPSFD